MTEKTKNEKVVPTQVFVSRQFFKSGKEKGKATGEDEVLTINKFVTEPAKVQVEYGLTLNLGNYESARVSVAVTVPCYREEIEDAHAFAADWCEDKLESERNKVREAMRGSAF
jgi:hypothetical protein